MNFKLKNFFRLFLHGTNYASLHKHINPENLPKRYGGKQEEYSYKPWIDHCRRNATVIKELELHGYTVDELKLNEEWNFSMLIFYSQLLLADKHQINTKIRLKPQHKHCENSKISTSLSAKKNSLIAEWKFSGFRFSFNSECGWFTSLFSLLRFFYSTI